MSWFTASTLRIMLASFLSLAILFADQCVSTCLLYTPYLMHSLYPMNASFWPFFIRIFQFPKSFIRSCLVFFDCLQVVFYIRQELFLSENYHLPDLDTFQAYITHYLLFIIMFSEHNSCANLFRITYQFILWNYLFNKSLYIFNNFNFKNETTSN